MKKQRRILWCVFAILLLAACTGCGGSGSGKLADEVQFPRYEDNGTSFRLAAYWPPSNFLRTDQHYREMAEANINYVYGRENTYGSRLEALDLCAKYNMKYLLYDRVIEERIRNDTATGSDLRELMARVDSFSTHSAFGGVYLIDEPSFSNMNLIKMFTDAFYAKYPDLEMMVNQTSVWQSMPIYVGPDGYEGCMEATLAASPGQLSFDNYPLYKGDPPYTSTTNVNNLEIVARLAQKHKVPFYNYLQCTEAYTYDTSRACDTYEEMAWQFNIDLAFGISGVQTYTYMSQDYSPEERIKAMLRKTGEVTETYWAFKEYTDELIKWDYVYEKFTWDGAMLIKKAGTILDDFDTVVTARKTHPRIKSVTNTQHAMIGTFFDREGRDGFQIVNYLDPFYKTTNTVTVEFSDAKYALIYEKGKRKVVETEAGKLTFKFSAGEAAFVIPFN